MFLMTSLAACADLGPDGAQNQKIGLWIAVDTFVAVNAAPKPRIRFVIC